MFEGTPAPLFYLDLYNFLDGAQNDTFEDSCVTTPGPNQTVLCLLNQTARYPGHVLNFRTVMQPQSTRQVNHRIGAPRGVNSSFYPFYATSFFDLFGGLQPHTADSSLNDRFPRFAANALHPNDLLPKLAANAGSQLLDPIQSDPGPTHPTPARAESRALHQSLIRALASVNPIQSFSQGAIPWPPIWVMKTTSTNRQCPKLV
ncbi:hypothetical protein EDB87DRAFT_1311486 [Lactarius vividus]|nr:hypothetical protein EDB87DRAFT_1311486 [Lactarius vividus]